MDTRSVETRLLRRSFLSDGSRLAAALFITGLKGTVFFWALSPQPAHTAATYGLVLHGVAVVVVVSSGAQLAVMTETRRTDAGDVLRSPGTRRALQSLSAATFALALMMLCALVAGGVGLLIVDPRAVAALPGNLVTAFYWSRIPSVALLPAASLITGLVVAAGRADLALTRALEGLFLTMALCVVLRAWSPEPLVALVIIGVTGAALDVAAMLRPLASLGPARHPVLRLLVAGLGTLRHHPVEALRLVPRVVNGGLDGVVLASAFVVLSVVAASVDPGVGAAAAALIALHRAVVVPLKSYGVVAARLALAPQGFEHLDPRRRLQICRRTAGLALGCLGALLVACPEIAQPLLGSGASADGATLAVRLLGAQLLLEHVAGLLQSALKVLTASTATLPALVVSLWGVSIPAVIALRAVDQLTVATLWACVAAGRVVCCLLLRPRLRAWERAQAPPPEH